MDESHFQKLQILKNCTFQSGGWQKRFVRDLSSKTVEETLTPKQTYYVDFLYYLYRRQIQGMWIKDKPPIIHPGDKPQFDEENQPTEVKIPTDRKARKVEETRRRMDEWNAKVKGKSE